MAILSVVQGLIETEGGKVFELDSSKGSAWLESVSSFRYEPTGANKPYTIPKSSKICPLQPLAQEMAFPESWRLTFVTEFVVAVAVDYLYRMTTGNLKRFATYFDLESGTA
jgi:hypothetical protein